MKWSIVGLLFFGVVAAVCAAVLVATLRAGSRPADVNTVDIFVAARPLARSKILDPSSIMKKTVSRREAPEDCVTNEVQVIGRVLAETMLEGQPFTKDCFASQGSGYRVASVLPEGMRAVTLSMFDYAGLYGILYPGCFVDVLSSFKTVEEGGPHHEAMSTTLLQGIQVLAVEEKTLVSEKEVAPEGKKSSSPTRVKRLLVTLMVDLEQANALQLATQYGTVSLALRNPTDEIPVRKNHALLSKLSSGQTPAWLKRIAGMPTAQALGGREAPGSSPSERGTHGPKGSGAESGPGASEDENLWKMTLIRGGVISTQAVQFTEPEVTAKNP